MRTFVNFAACILSVVFAPTVTAQNIPATVVSYLNKQGPIENGLFLRGRYPAQQIVVHYCINDGLPGGKLEGANNASAVHCKVVLFNRNKNGKWSYGDEIEIGQGIIRTLDYGFLSGESVTYSPNDALCCPSQKTPFRFSIVGGKFVNAPETTP